MLSSATFECGRCNDCFTKKKAEAHLMTRCSGAVTCVDCNVVFDITSIKAHTSCVTETDKYAGRWLAKQKVREPSADNKPRAEFVPPLPYAMDDSDGDSDIAIPSQSPITGPKAAAVAPTVISLVFADEHKRRHQEKLAKVELLQSTSKYATTQMENGENGSAAMPPPGAVKKEKKSTKHEDELNNGAKDKAQHAAVSEAANGADECGQEPKEKKSKKEKRERQEEIVTVSVAEVTANNEQETKKEKKKKSKVEVDVEDAPIPEILVSNGCEVKKEKKRSEPSTTDGHTNGVSGDKKRRHADADHGPMTVDAEPQEKPAKKPKTPKGEPEAQEDPVTEPSGKEKKKRKDKETTA